MVIIAKGQPDTFDNPISSTLLTQDEVENKANPEKIFWYEDTLKEIQENKNLVRDTLNEIIGEYSEAKKKVRAYLVENLATAQDNTKKTAGMEILEAYVCHIGDEQIKKDYENYIFYGAKKDLLGKMLDSYNQDQSVIQSKMKFDDWTGRK